MSNPFSMKATSSGGTEVPPAGSHPAILVAIVDLGTHNEEFKDKASGEVKVVPYRKVLLAWELTGEPMSGTKNLNNVVGRDYNLAFSPKAALRVMIEKWRGKPFADGEEFDVTKILGKPCMVTITHGTSSRGNTFAKLDGVAPAPKGMTVPPAKCPLYTFTVGEGEFQPPLWLPTHLYGEKVADLIARCNELKANHQTNQAAAAPTQQPQPVGAGASEDSIPF